MLIEEYIKDNTPNRKDIMECDGRPPIKHFNNYARKKTTEKQTRDPAQVCSKSM